MTSSDSRRLSYPPRTVAAPGASVLVLYCHPAPHRSRVNQALRAAITGLEGVTIHDLYETYPDATLNVEYEQELLLQHSTIVFQHPFYWYSTPPLLKEWQDIVLTWGWAYGKDGNQLRGKRLMSAITTGGSGHAYQPDGHNRFTIPELLAPIAATAYLCGMEYLAPFTVHGTHRLTDAEIHRESERYRDTIDSLRAV